MKITVCTDEGVVVESIDLADYFAQTQWQDGGLSRTAFLADLDNAVMRGYAMEEGS